MFSLSKTAVLIRELSPKRGEIGGRCLPIFSPTGITTTCLQTPFLVVWVLTQWDSEDAEGGGPTIGGHHRPCSCEPALIYKWILHYFPPLCFSNFTNPYAAQNDQILSHKTQDTKKKKHPHIVNYMCFFISRPFKWIEAWNKNRSGN